MTGRRFAAHDRHLLGKEPQSLRQLHRPRGLGAMWVNALSTLNRKIISAWSKHIQGSRRLTTLDRIHHDERREPFHEPQHEVHASNADVHGLNGWGQFAGGQSLYHFDAEAIIAEKHIPKAHDQ